jgi:hypothetical protein
MSDHLKEQVSKLFAETTEAPDALPQRISPRNQRIGLTGDSSRDIIPEAKRSRLHSPLLQFVGLLAFLIPIGFTVKSCFAPSTSVVKPSQTQLAGVAPAQAAPPVIVCGPKNESNPVCQLQKINANNLIKNQKGSILPQQVLSKQKSTPAPKLSSPKPPTQFVTKIIRLRPSDSPSPRQFSQSFSPPPSRPRTFARPYRQAITQPRQTLTPEQQWEEQSRAGVTSSSNENSFSPEPAYVAENSTEIEVTDGGNSSGAFQGRPKAEGAGELITPIQLTSDIDASQEEYEIKVTKAVGALPEGTIVYAKIDGTPSQSGLITLTPTRSSQGDVSAIKLKSTKDGKFKAALKGTGKGFWNTAATILFGGARIAMGGLFGGGGALNDIAQSTSGQALSAGQSALQSGRRQAYFEVSKGTDVKIISY